MAIGWCGRAYPMMSSVIVLSSITLLDIAKITPFGTVNMNPMVRESTKAHMSRLRGALAHDGAVTVIEEGWTWH
ncbi:hypothetical protein BGW80DRAFT_1278276 [Lactifluus volemus]|nr:hypothetical protein BGW80DRAFT_1278276 [Lactifluus volemus]